VPNKTDRPGPPPDEAELVFDDVEARGVVTLRRGRYGPTVVVNGVEWGWIDLSGESSHGGGGDPPQLLLYSTPETDELMCRVVAAPGGLRVVVSAHCASVPPAEAAITYDGDLAFEWPADPPPEGG